MKDVAKERLGTYRSNDGKDEERLAELILHIANKCETDPTFGAIKLNKLLWWADFLSYARYGEPITGTEYYRLERGPAPRRLVPVRNNLVASGAAIVREHHRFNKIQKRLVPLREAQYDLFTARQIALIDELIDAYWDKSAREMSEESHGKAWEIARDRQSIPYEAIFLSDDPTYPSDVRRTHELAEEYEWSRSGHDDS